MLTDTWAILDKYLSSARLRKLNVSFYVKRSKSVKRYLCLGEIKKVNWFWSRWVKCDALKISYYGSLIHTLVFARQSIWTGLSDWTQLANRALSGWKYSGVLYARRWVMRQTRTLLNGIPEICEISVERHVYNVFPQPASSASFRVVI